MLLDNWCCQLPMKLYQVERCLGGDQLTSVWTFTGLLERNIGISTDNGVDMVNTSSSVAYISGDEPFIGSLDYNLNGYYVEYILPNGKSEFYRVNGMAEGYDFECCNIDHYEVDLERVRKPTVCQ